MRLYVGVDGGASKTEAIILNEKHWPDYTESDFKNDIDKFRSRERRFGKTK